ncbi:MAG: 50S ribosomal protein L4 [Bacteroidota bacterium]
MTLTVYTREGSDAGRTVELDQSVFGIEPNDHAIWLDVRAAQAHARQGTHKTKGRSEVRGSTRKLYRQKGTGHARVGDAKSPTRRGGGIIFGPRPHSYSVGVNRKTKQLARRSALAHKARQEGLRIVENFQFDAPKTRDLARLLSSHDLGGRKVLLLTGEHDDVLHRSGRNIPKLTVRPAAGASTLDLMNAHVILLQEGALSALTDALGKTAATSAPVEPADAEPADAAE